MRRKIIAGNWKMNKTPVQTEEFVNEIKDKLQTGDRDVVFCVPYVDLAIALELVKGTGIKIAAQNMHFEDRGAYTGEISAEMLVSMGVEYVVIGHSERREYFGETDLTVNKKVLKALKNGLIPIVCVGETLEQRELGITADWVRMQTRIALTDVDAEAAKGIIIAYEPIWAIGTGRNATGEQAEDVCRVIREAVKEIYNGEVSEAIRVQYGGSVNGKNADELFNMPNIDGGLVGGASIKDEFVQVVNYTPRA